MAVSQDILKVQHRERDQSVCVCVCVRGSVSGRGWDGWMDGRGGHTSCDPQHSHDADDGGVDR